MALSVPLSRFTPRVGGGSAFFVRCHSRMTFNNHMTYREQISRLCILVGVLALLYVAFCQYELDFHKGWEAAGNEHLIDALRVGDSEAEQRYSRMIAYEQATEAGYLEREHAGFACGLLLLAAAWLVKRRSISEPDSPANP